jgi:histidinol-phosphatase
VESNLDSSASEHLRVALAAAKEAAEISRRYYAGNFTVMTKADMTPVTQADVECEQAIRKAILACYPDHGFYGEETGRTLADADYLWLVDPIDGTKGFVRQYPFFSTQIALMHKGEIILGVSSGTMMDELAWAEQGCGAWLNGRRLSVSEIVDPDRAAVSVGNLKSLAASEGWSAQYCQACRSNPGLRRFLPLSFAGRWQDRSRDRIRCQYSGYCRALDHRYRGRRTVYGHERG